MSSFRTEITLLKPKSQIDITHNILSIGSCFADNIGKKVLYYKFNSLINPFGVLYNPQSIADNLFKTIDKYQFTEKDLVCKDDVWNSFFHHSKYANINKNQLLDDLKNLTNNTNNFLQKADYILITFGTSWVYKLNKNDEIVANCHKLPSNYFTRYKLSVTQIVAVYTELIDKIKSINPHVKFIFTVSPVRHLKDGMIENQQSKATLLLAVSEITNKFTNAHYFPSYEIMMDDLRDYRFYADDMLHPSDFAVNYIWQKFAETWINTKTHSVMRRIEKLMNALNHRPFMPNTETYQQFLQKQLEKFENITKEYSYLNFEKEIQQVKERLIS